MAARERSTAKPQPKERGCVRSTSRSTPSARRSQEPPALSSGRSAAAGLSDTAAKNIRSARGFRPVAVPRAQRPFPLCLCSMRFFAAERPCAAAGESQNPITKMRTADYTDLTDAEPGRPVAAGIPACRRAGLPSPAETTPRQSERVGKSRASSAFQALFRAAGMRALYGSQGWPAATPSLAMFRAVYAIPFCVSCAALRPFIHAFKPSNPFHCTHSSHENN